MAISLPRVTQSGGLAGAGATTFFLTGVKDLDRKLLSLASENGTASVKKILRKSIRESVKKHVLPAARANAPKDTGALKRAMTVRAAKFKGRDKIGSRVFIKPEKLAKEYFYPAVLEFGSVKRNIPARKFLRKALYGKQTEVRAAVIEGIREAVNKAARA